MRSLGEEVREYIIWGYSFLPYWPCTYSRPLGNDACLLLFFEIIINEVLNKVLDVTIAICCQIRTLLGHSSRIKVLEEAQ